MQKAATGVGVFSHSQIHKTTEYAHTGEPQRKTREENKSWHTHRGMRERCYRQKIIKTLFDCENVGWKKVQSKSPTLVIQSTSNNCGICYSKGLHQLSKGIFTAKDDLSWLESADDFANVQLFPVIWLLFTQKNPGESKCVTYNTYKPRENVQSAYRAGCIWARINKSSNCSY